MNEQITIDKKYYEELCKEVFFLNCLKAQGVDNWEGYDDAVDEYKAMYDE